MPGWMDLNPARAEHLLEGYFGGMAKTLMQAGETLVGVVEAATTGSIDPIVTRNIPVVNRFINVTDERNSNARINEKYFNYKAEYDLIDQAKRGYNKEINGGGCGCSGSPAR